MSLADFIDNRIVPVLSLSKFDASWSKVISESIPGRIWLGLRHYCQKHLAALAFLGTICEVLSFLLVLLLFLVLPAPQFADDKGVLALLVLAASGMRIFGLLLNQKDEYKPCAVDILVLAFAAMNVIATSASHYLLPSLKGLSKMLVYFCSYFLFASTLQKQARKRSVLVLAALVGAGVLVSLYGIYQYKIGVAPLATWEDPTVEDKTTRVFSTLKNPNLLAGYLVPLIPLSFSMAIMAFVENGWKKLLSLPALACAAAITVCCWLTGSRGGWGGIAAGLAALGFVVVSSLWSKTPKLRPWLLLLVLVIPVLVVLGLHQFPKYEHRILSIFAGREHSSNSYRMNVYAASFRMFLDSWWIGVGPGNATFKLAYGLYMRSGFDALGTYCVPLEVAVETGVVGLGVFVCLLMASLARAHHNFWNNLKGSERWLAAGAAAALVGMMVHGLVDTVYYRPQVQFIFWLLLALCMQVQAAEQKTVSTELIPKEELDQNKAA